LPALLALGAVGGDDPALERNGKVVEFARSQVGRKVGDGECTTLVTQALRAAGARRTPVNRGDGDYLWGRPVASFREALPGDVVQFRDVVFRGKRYLSKRRWTSWHNEYPHHTAIVAAVRERGESVDLLHQNVGGDGATDAERRVVSQTTIRPGSLQKGGTFWIYRPVGPDEPVGPPSSPTPDPDARPAG
jgi:hypothetical protein